MGGSGGWAGRSGCCGATDGQRTGHDQRQTDEGLDWQPFAEYRHTEEDGDHRKEERHEGASGGANASDDNEIQAHRKRGAGNAGA